MFTEAVDLPPGDRAAFLARACPDAGMRAEVEAMLAADAQADAFFADAALHLADVAEELTASPPKRAGPWRLGRLLGRGGMGEVYRAERADADAPGGFAQQAAVKLVQPGLAPGLVARFHAERRILAGLDHPGIARLLDGGTASDGRPYLAMDLVEGEPITTYCDRHRLGVDARLALFEAVCDAVAYAHRRLVVHRDLKPANVLVSDTPDGPRVTLLDFGVARLLDDERDAMRTVLHALTPEYAAPEQLRGDLPTTATDVYALGVLLYELLAGQRPFRLPSRLAAEAARVVLDERPTDPSVAVRQTTVSPKGHPPATTPDAIAEARATRPDRLHRRLRGDLDRIAQVALRKEPARRYASAEALGRDVRRHLEGMPVEARPASVAYRVGRFVRRHRGAVAAAVLGVLGLAGWGATATAQRARIATERDRAERFADVLETLFTEANPYADDADRLTAATPLGDALHASARRVEADLAADPEARFRLLASIGGSLAGIGADSLAADVFATNRRLATAAFGPDDARTIRALRDEGAHLGETADTPADRARADTLLRRALMRSERVHGATARETGEAAIDLATFVKDEGEIEDAERLAARGVSIARRHRPEADLATALMIHALILGQRGDAAAAWEAAREAAEIARAERPDDSANLISVLANAATAAEAAGAPEQALALEREAAALAHDRLGPSHPTTLTVRANLATTLAGLDRYAEAEAEHRAVLDQRLARDGPLSVEAAISFNQLAGVLRRARRLDQASATYGRAATAFEASLPDTHPYRAIPYVALASVDADRGRFADAERHARAALRLAARSFPEDDPIHGHARARLGRSLIGQGRRAEGVRELDAGLAHLRSTLPADDEGLAEAEGWRRAGR